MATATRIPLRGPVMLHTPPPATEAALTPAVRRLEYGDAVRVLGTIAVVVGHVCDMTLFGPDVQPLSLNWWVCNVVDAAARWAVPAYIMLSGALLLDPARSESPSLFYRKRLARIGIPLVFWSAFFMLFSVYYTQWRSGRQAWHDLFMGEPYAHLHFVFRIAGLYALTPMIRVFLRHAPRSMILAATGILLGLWCADSVVDGFTETKLSAFARFAPFMGYYLAGYALRDYALSRRAFVWCWAGLIGCIVVLAGGTGVLVHYFGMKAFPSLGMLLYDFLSPVRIPMAIFTWLILVNTPLLSSTRPSAFRSAITYLAPATLGIYLVHPAFREILYLHGFSALWPSVGVGIAMTTAMVYLPSVVAVVVLMRIPWLQRLVS